MFKRTLIAFLGFFVVLGYQNCAQPKFSSLSTLNNNGDDNQLVIDPTPGENPETPGNPENPETPASPTPYPSPTPKGHPPATHPPTTNNEGEDGTGCPKVDIAKVLLSVNHVELQPAHVDVAVAANTVVDLLNLDTTGFTFGPISGTDPQPTIQVRLVLNSDGNMIVGTDNKTYALKTPSAQQSGYKLLLPSPENLQPGKSYTIKADFDPSSKIVRAGDKCILKPVLKVTEIKEAAAE